MSQVVFYSVREDMLALAGEVEASRELSYYRFGELQGRAPSAFRHAMEIAGFGAADADASVRCSSFLVLPATVPVEVRATGGAKARKLIDQLVNPHSIVVAPGGLWANAIVLAGSVGTASESPTAQALVRAFERRIKKSWAKVGRYLVSPGAMTRLRAGARLCHARSANPAADLRLGEG